ncbi:MAG TPA: hypothetical protein VMM78_18780 [Thermomicrobiales bacterium]|nr:hypothetical protein [Thermomicrobiales bacterium]
MSAVRDQIAERSRTLLFVMAYAGIVGALSVALNAADAAGGEIPAIGRLLLGLVGVVAAALLWTRPRLGWLVALIWAAIQIPYIAWSVEGSPVSQVLYFPISASSQTTVNGEITSFSEFGVNLIGIVLTFLINRWRSEWIYRNK